MSTERADTEQLSGEPKTSARQWPQLLTLNQLMVLLLSAILLFAGIDKLLHYDGFVNALRDYVLVPRGTASYLAMPVILVEILLGLSLWSAWRRAALLSTGVLFLVFTAALLVNYRFGNAGICGCWFTFTLAQSNEAHIVQNVVLAVMALTVWFEEKPSPNSDEKELPQP